MLDAQFVSDSNNLILLSGGADSTALLYLMHEQGKVDKVIHFNHQLRGEESDAEQVFCEKLCKELKSDLIVINLDLSLTRRANEGDEGLARRLRLEALEKNYADYNIYMAHHRNDVEETFFMRAYRGANSGGLCGLRKFSQLGQLKIFRPLLDCKPEQLKQYLSDRGLGWCEDSSNRNEQYCKRNLLRVDLLPKLRTLGDGLVHTLNHLECEDDYLQIQAKKHVSKSLSADLILGLHPALLPRVLRLWFFSKGIHYVASTSCLSRIVKECKKIPDNFKDFPLQEGHVLRLWQNGKLDLVEGENDLELQWDIHQQDEIQFGAYRFYKSKDAEVVFSAQNITEPLIIRCVKKGDKIQAFGRSKPSVVSKFLSDAKIDLEERLAYPVICHDQEIILVPGVRRSNFAPYIEGEDKIGIAFERL